jgi:hypothetical protein
VGTPVKPQQQVGRGPVLVCDAFDEVLRMGGSGSGDGTAPEGALATPETKGE